MIESRAFADCPNLEILIFEGSPYSISDDILSGSDKAVIVSYGLNNEAPEEDQGGWAGSSTVECPSSGRDVAAAYDNCPYCGNSLWG